MVRDRPRLGSVRVQVTALATVVVAVVLVVAGVLLVLRQRAGLIEQLDDSLETEAEAIAASVEAGGAAPVPSGDDRVVEVSEAGSDEVAGTAGDDPGRDVTIDGEAYRAVSVPVDAPRGAVVRVAAPLDDVDESVARLTTSLLWIVPVATALLAVLVWVLVGRTLRPVEQIRARVAGIGLGDLDQRVPEPPGDDEIARLAVTMNEMLARLERSVRRQQRFVADASHELRTPLTRMRTELEVDARHPEAADVAATRASQLAEIAAMQRLIDDLLVLARSDAGADRRAERIDLDDVVLEELRALPGPPPTIDSGGVSAAQVIGDRDELRRVVRNLLDNACRHAATAVTVVLAEIDGQARLSVADDGSGITPDRRAEVFERFSRLDEARSGGAGRAGLGLAIVHDIVTRHGGEVTVDAGPAGGARFVVALPIA